jgi:phosphate transport system substrate-binding protein
MNGRKGKPGQTRAPDGIFGTVLRYRFWIYGVVLLGLIIFRGLPILRSQLERYREEELPANRLTLAGLDLAPVLIPRLADAYQRLYPEQDLRLLTGGTRQALEDLFNQRADVAFLNRPLTAEEEEIVRSVGDTALAFPIALGAIAILGSGESLVDSLPVAELRQWLQGGERARPQRRPQRIYGPDPNLGLWTALTEQLDLRGADGREVVWLADDQQVAEAVRNDPGSVGFASLLALPTDLSRLGVQAIRVTGAPEQPAAVPRDEEVATGEYPLFHYLYVACRPQGGTLASGFVTFLHSGRGQRLVAREGFLPARNVPREIQLSSEPVVKAG